MRAYGKDRFPGRLFIVEGIDGSGKSIQLALLQKWLKSEGYGYEAGMDLRLREDMFDSFTAYQGRLLNVFDTMAGEYAFHVVDSSASIQNVSEQIKSLLEPLLITV